MKSERRPERRHLRPDQVIAIAAAHASGGNARALAEAYGVSVATIHAAVKEVREGRLRSRVHSVRRLPVLVIDQGDLSERRQLLAHLGRPQLEARYLELRGRSGRTLLSSSCLIDIIVWSDTSLGQP